jgi:hypothetical protein
MLGTMKRTNQMKTITDAELATLAAIQGKFCESKAKRVGEFLLCAFVHRWWSGIFFVELFTDACHLSP